MMEIIIGGKPKMNEEDIKQAKTIELVNMNTGKVIIVTGIKQPNCFQTIDDEMYSWECWQPEVNNEFMKKIIIEQARNMYGKSVFKKHENGYKYFDCDSYNITCEVFDHDNNRATYFAYTKDVTFILIFDGTLDIDTGEYDVGVYEVK